MRSEWNDIIRGNIGKFDGNFTKYAQLLSQEYDGSWKAWEARIRELRIKSPDEAAFLFREAHTHSSEGTVTKLSSKDVDDIEDEEQWITDADTFYNDTNDTYVTWLRSAGKAIVVPGAIHRAIKQAYSNMVGSGATINEIARDFSFPRHWFDEYRRRHGWTHDMDPFTDEEIRENETEDLVDDLVLRRRRLLHRADEKRRWKDIQSSAEKWESFEEVVMEEMRHYVSEAGNAPDVSLVDMSEANNPYALVMSPTDFHWGKYGWEDEVGERYDLEEAKRRLVTTTNEIIGRLPGRPEKIILATGSDWFHVDTDLNTTTRGTSMDSCATPANILITGCKMAREHVDMLRQVAPIDIVFMPGNHDRHSAYALMLYLSAVYENCEDVTVEISPAVRNYRTYGNTLIGFTHGDKMNKNKLPAVMASEKASDWGLSTCRVWFTGHLHHQQLHEIGGTYVIILPSLAGHDRYHHRAGFILAKAGLAAHIIDKEHGLAGSLFIPVVTE